MVVVVDMAAVSNLSTLLPSPEEALTGYHIPVQEVTSKATREEGDIREEVATREEEATAINESPSIVSRQSLQLVAFDSLLFS